MFHGRMGEMGVFVENRLFLHTTAHEIPDTMSMGFSNDISFIKFLVLGKFLAYPTPISRSPIKD